MLTMKCGTARWKERGPTDGPVFGSVVEVSADCCLVKLSRPGEGDAQESSGEVN